MRSFFKSSRTSGIMSFNDLEKNFEETRDRRRNAEKRKQFAINE